MNRRNFVIVTIGIIILAASGCGGGGGGSGRYTLATDVTGSGTGTGGGGGTGTTTTETNPDSLLLSGWEDFKYGAYSSAISKFNQVLTISSITDSQKSDAYNGVGWSLAKSSGVESGYSSFAQAASLQNESKVGLAAALIQRGQRSAFATAIQNLEAIGLGNTAYTFTETHPIGVSNAEAHAMLALCYFWRNASGDTDKARSQINAARSLDSSSDSSVAQIYATLKALGLTGI